MAFQALVEDVGLADARNILAVFLSSNAQRLRAMQDSVSAGSHDDIAREAHSMKSAAAILGFAQLSEQARALEMEAATLGHDDLVRRIVQLATTFAKVEDSGRRMLEARKS